MRAIATLDLTRDGAVGFWRERPYRALDRLTLDVELEQLRGAATYSLMTRLAKDLVVTTMR